MVTAVMAVAALLGGCAGAAGAKAPTDSPAPAIAEAVPLPASPSPGPVPPARGDPPARLTVPDLGLDEELIDLGIGTDGTMEVPQDFSRVGWFTGGGRPGGIGPTVIAGHVDSAVGPAVFYELGLLQAGDRFSVTDVTGATFAYEVYRAEDFAKNEFPTAEVFGALLDDEVRLITCTGLFDESIGHYEDNRVVFAARVA